MDFGDIFAWFIGLIFVSGVIALIWTALTSQPVKIIFGALLVLIFGTAFILASGFACAHIISWLFSITDPQMTVALGLVGSFCAGMLAIAIAIGIASIDIVESINHAASRDHKP